MQVTSNYYRYRAQRASYCAESLTLQEKAPSNENDLPDAASEPVPLRPSRKTLRRFANLHKNESENRVA